MDQEKINAMRIMNVFILLIVLTLWSCEKTKQEPQAVQVHSITSKKAVVDWVGVFTNENDMSYQVYLSDSLVTEVNNAFFYVINGLVEETNYSGQIVAYNMANDIRYTMPFSFVTKINYKPHEFLVELNSITGESVSVSWEKPFDPEGDSITYNLILNHDTVVYGLKETNQSIHGLASATRYLLTVLAKDGHGNDVPQSVTFKTTEPGAEISYVKKLYASLDREYGIYLPSGTGTENLPLVINLHGFGGIVWPDMTSDYFVTLAEKEQFILLKPQAMADNQGNVSWRLSYDLDFIQQLIDTVIVRHQVDLERIYLTGHSAGAFTTYNLAKALEYRLAAIGAIAGTLTQQDYYNYSLQKPMPLCHIHGTADSTVQVQGNETHISFEKILEFFIPHNHCYPDPTVIELPDIYKFDNSTVTKFIYNTQDISSGDIVYYRINNGNHSVPGTTSWANKDINAYDVLWDFFKTRKLSDK